MKFSTIFVVSFAAVLLLFNAAAAAKSQCVGLTKTQCNANATCSWRKASVNKNGVKTKAHCRALPNQGKSTTKKVAKKEAKASSKTTTEKKKSSKEKKKSTKDKNSSKTKSSLKEKKPKKDKKTKK